jgi:hypothetical protein
VCSTSSHLSIPGMLLAGEVATAPLAMAAALGVAFVGSLSIGAFVVSKALRASEAGNTASGDTAERASSTHEEAA